MGYFKYIILTFFFPNHSIFFHFLNGNQHATQSVSPDHQDKLINNMNSSRAVLSFHGPPGQKSWSGARLGGPVPSGWLSGSFRTPGIIP